MGRMVAFGDNVNLMIMGGGFFKTNIDLVLCENRWGLLDDSR